MKLLIILFINPHAKITEKVVESVQEMMLRLTGDAITYCPECGQGVMVSVESLPVAGLDTS